MPGTIINLNNVNTIPCGYGDADTGRPLTSEEFDNQLIKWGISKRTFFNTIRNGTVDQIRSVMSDAHVFMLMY